MANLTNADRNALERAARLIETKGWTTGAPARDAENKRLSNAKDQRASCYCTLGALWAASEDETQYDRLYKAVVGALPNSNHLVWVFNDYEARDASDVTALFRRAAA